MNVTAKHGQAAVHTGGQEFTNGRWSPLCGIQHHNAGDRTPTPLRPTDKAVTCKRCLKIADSAVQTEKPVRKTAAVEKPFHRTVKDAIGLKF